MTHPRTESIQERLRRLPMFQHLSPQETDTLLAQAKVARYAKGQTLFHQGEPATAVWFALEGWVHLVRTAHQKGRHAVVLFTITPKESLCGVSAIELGTYTASGVAGTDSEVASIPAPLFQRALLHDPAFAYHVLRLCAERIQRMAEQYETMTEQVSSRIIRAILRLNEQFGRTIPVTHRELAQMSWTTTESAIRIVRKLKRRGALTGSRGHVMVSRPAALQSYLAPRNGHRAIPAP